jgi:hypothetical protein
VSESRKSEGLKVEGVPTSALPEDGGAALREMAMRGVGPTWRGHVLLPAADHVDLLERTDNAIISSRPAGIFDVMAFLFIMTADEDLVFDAAYPLASDGSASFSMRDWQKAVHKWARSLDPRLDAAECKDLGTRLGIVNAQIAASGFRSVDGDGPSSERDSGN